MPEATLTDVLAARERRAESQQTLLSRYGVPVICFTLNIAGPVKVDAWTEYAFAEGRERLLSALESMRCRVAGRLENASVAGRELLLAVDAPAERLKDLCVALEETDALGRLFDMDVLGVHGEKLERPRERCCLVCGAPGRGCASRRLHPLPEIQAKTRAIIAEHRRGAMADRAAALATRALLDEVLATPKPGLVDRANCGSHRDMDVFTFAASASALWPYFRRCFEMGARDRSLEPGEAFGPLKALGLKAERDMLRATEHVNTHKGAIYSLGLLCAAAGRTMPEAPDGEAPTSDALLRAAGSLAEVHARDAVPSETHGGQAKARYGIGGVREEAAAGFPAVREIGLPALRRAREAGLGYNDQCLAALLHLIAGVQDTNMIARGGIQKAEEARNRVRELLTDTTLPARAALEALDADFARENLSPGGCADLLAATLFLTRYFDEESRKYTHE